MTTLRKCILCSGVSVLALVFLFALAMSAEEITLKLWSRADRTGPDRPGNIVAAADLLNRIWKVSGVDKTVKVDIHENNAKGFDEDAIQLLKAFAVDKGPDFYVAAHEWVGEFAAAGYAMNMEEHIARFPEYYEDMIPVLWESVKYQGKRYAIPQDSEIRMFFYNKDMLRKIGKDEAFIENLPAMVEAGEFTIWDLSKLAKEVVDKGAAKVGIIHRPNVGPDYLMTFSSFGVQFMDEASGKLLLTKKPLEEALKWFDWNVKNGVTPHNNTAMSWDTINKMLPSGEAFIKHHGIWDVPRQAESGLPSDGKEYLQKIGWLHSPAADKGGQPKNLSHPIVYVVNPKSPHAELAAMVVAIASMPEFNTRHAVGSYHTGIKYAQTGMPVYRDHWALSAATPMLARSTFMPNHPKFGRYNAILFKGLQAVETGRLSPAEAVEFISDEMKSDLGDDVLIK